MRKLLFFLLVLCLCFLHSTGCTDKREATSKKGKITTKADQDAQKEAIFKEEIAKLNRKYPHIFKLRGQQRPGERQVSLTFDDGPDSSVTPLILDILKEQQIHATFFLVGSRVKKYPKLVQRIADEGHVIGNHTYDHPRLKKLTLPAFERQIRDTELTIKEAIKYKPRYFRPSYGAMSEEQVLWAGKHGYIIVEWDADSKDWKEKNAERIFQNVVNLVVPGSIVLQHDLVKETAEALPIRSKKKKSKAQTYNAPIN